MAGFWGPVYCHSTAILQPVVRRRWLRSIISLPTFHDVSRHYAFRLAALGARFVPLVPLVSLVSLVSLVLHPKGEAIDPDTRCEKRARQWKQAGTVTKNNLNALGRGQETREQHRPAPSATHSTGRRGVRVRVRARVG
jgi:hypothetical protein